MKRHRFRGPLDPHEPAPREPPQAALTLDAQGPLEDPILASGVEDRTTDEIFGLENDKDPHATPKTSIPRDDCSSEPR